MKRQITLLAACLFAVMSGIGSARAVWAAPPAGAQTQAAASGTPAVQQVLGTIKSIEGKSITVTSDQGTSTVVLVPETARIVRVEPGQTDLKNAAKIALADLQVGDRVLVRGGLSDDASSLVATVVMGMKRAAIQAKQQLAMEEWKKRGVGGLVSRVDPATGVITISVVAPTGERNMSIFTTKDTILRRYAPDSVKVDDAKPGTLSQIQAGDQLQARGARNIDGSQMTADEIISGAFRNIAGTIDAVDAANGTLTVTDLATKKHVVVKVTPQSQIRKLSPGAAQGIAMRLKAAGKPAGAAPNTAAAANGATANGGTANGEGRQGDFQQLINRMPQAALADLQKGDAVMIVATQTENSGEVTGVMLVGGVEPLLTAAPNGGQGMTLSPWSLGGGGEAPEASQ